MSDDLSAFEIKQWADEEITRLCAEVERLDRLNSENARLASTAMGKLEMALAEVERLTRELDEALVSKGVAITMRIHAENRSKTAEARVAELEAGDNILREVHKNPIVRAVLEERFPGMVQEIDAALAPKEPGCPPPSA